MTTPNISLHRSAGRVFLNLFFAFEVVADRGARSIPTLGRRKIRLNRQTEDEGDHATTGSGSVCIDANRP